ncbi:MAG: tetratricopeptide repeat protein [Deltaproteobacteria bacterium]|nr:tetratricopeptide repeat protein [Deltaproteobacteria bacterium]
MKIYDILNIHGPAIYMKTAVRYILLITAAAAAVSCGPTIAERKEKSVVHYRLGVVHLNERKFPEALKELTEAVAAYPEDPSYHNALGLAYFARAMNKEGAAHMLEAVRLDPKFSEAHANLSAVYIAEGRWDSAIAEAKAALDNIFYRTPEIASYNMGRAYFSKGDYKAALEAFKKAIEANANYPDAHYNLGQAYDKLNNWKGAVEAYERAVRITPDYIEAHYGLGLAYIKEKNMAAARKSFEKVIGLAPESDMARSSRDYINLLSK